MPGQEIDDSHFHAVAERFGGFQFLRQTPQAGIHAFAAAVADEALVAEQGFAHEVGRIADNLVRGLARARERVGLR